MKVSSHKKMDEGWRGLWLQKKMRSSNGTSKCEIGKYLGEESEDDINRFDIPECWKVNSYKFLILAHLAHDVLDIPISIVA